MINIAEILKDCPKETKLYSPLFGEIKFNRIAFNDLTGYNCICVDAIGHFYTFDKFGRFFSHFPDGECLLFPSKDQRNWTKFKVKKEEKVKKKKFDPRSLKPFDKVLIRYGNIWYADLFFHYEERARCCYTSSYFDTPIIPYNRKTKHLIGTTDDCPEYYKWWEK